MPSLQRRVEAGSSHVAQAAVVSAEQRARGKAKRRERRRAGLRRGATGDAGLRPAGGPRTAAIRKRDKNVSVAFAIAASSAQPARSAGHPWRLLCALCSSAFSALIVALRAPLTLRATSHFPHRAGSICYSFSATFHVPCDRNAPETAAICFGMPAATSWACPRRPLPQKR
jgi:hypothetical protein